MTESSLVGGLTRRGRPRRAAAVCRLALALIAVLALLAAACGDDSTVEPVSDLDRESQTETTLAADADTTPAANPRITLAANPWNGSAVNVAVAKQLLESELGYEVEIVDIDENAQWASINTGDISASLEVWPSGHAQNVADFIDNPDASVDNAGQLGLVGKIGWFTPTYMIERHPELATWEGFADPELAGLYATAETGDLGQFLGGDPSFVQYDEDIIQNLNLPLQVVYAGSETAILAAVDSAYSREEPILVYLWTPHSAFSSYDLTNVLLPEYSEECYAAADDGGVDCDYPSDVLFKIIDANLAENAPAADAFLRAMTYGNADQISMLGDVEGEGMSVEDAAARWIAANESTWSAWIN